MYQKNVILYLGAGHLDKYIIINLKEKGFRVIAVDRNNEAKGKNAANIFINVDGCNVNKIFNSIKSHICEDEVLDVFPSGERFIDTAIKLKEELGIFKQKNNHLQLPYNKSQCKKIWIENDVRTPKGVTLSLENIYSEIKFHNIKFPAMVKPVDGWAGEGIARVEKESDIRMEIEALRKKETKNIIIEEFIEGVEIVTGGVINQNLYQPFFDCKILPEKSINQTEYCILGVTINCNTLTKIHQLVEKASQSINMCDGIISGNLILNNNNNNNNNVVLFEIDPVYPLALLALFHFAGIDTPLVRFYENKLGITKDHSRQLKLCKNIYGYKQIFIKTPGITLKSVSGIKNAQKVEGILKIILIREVGRMLPQGRGELLPVVILFATASSEKGLIELLDSTSLLIKIKTLVNDLHH
jgi:hypothetical protein